MLRFRWRERFALGKISAGLIANTITRTGQQFELATELIDPETGATVRSYKERSYGEDHILEALDSIAGRVRADLGESLYEIRRPTNLCRKSRPIHSPR